MKNKFVRSLHGVIALAVCWLPSQLAAQAPAAQRNAAHEPTVAEVVRMAQRAALHTSPERTRALARRARLSGLVPSLRLGADRGLRQALSASSGGESEHTNESLGDDVSVDAALTFELPRLVFAAEEVRLLSVDRWLAQDRKRLLDDVVKLYFQRRRLLLERARAAAPDPELDLAIAEAESLLDAFTDGAFGQALSRSKRAPGRASEDWPKSH